MNLAIKGHATRGKEVIQLLEMLGGRNVIPFLKGDALHQFYHIRESNNEIICFTYSTYKDGYKVFTLEEFEEKFPYKVGDKVSSKYLKNYKIEKIEWEDTSNRVIYKLQGMGWYSVDELQPYKEETMEEGDKAMAPTLVGEDYSRKRFGYKIPQGYEFDCIQNNEIIIKPIKPQYPKTDEECARLLNTYCGSIGGYNWKLLSYFQKLLICRDAYWKIAGEVMGLGKPWEPDWDDDEWSDMYYISFDGKHIDKEKGYPCCNMILIFPTKEMRDAFYENFKDLIELCKELL